MTYNEIEEFEVCGVSYRATRQQANEIMSIVVDTKDWVNFAVTNDLIQHGDFDAMSLEAAELCKRHADNFRAAFKTAKKIIDNYLGIES